MDCAFNGTVDKSEIPRLGFLFQLENAYSVDGMVIANLGKMIH